MVCDPKQETPKVLGGNANYPYEMTYVYKGVCPIGVCPQGCNYAKGTHRQMEAYPFRMGFLPPR